MMADWGSLAILALAVGAGALVQAATGFGFAILAAPAFLWVLDSKTVMPMLIALHVVQSLMLVPQVAHRASRRHLGLLLAGALVGGPVGLWLLASFDVRQLKLAIGSIILLVISLIIYREAMLRGGRRGAGKGHGRGATMLTGAVSGAMTGLLAMPGPPLMVYFMSENRSPEAVRALSLTFFAVCYVAITLFNVVVPGFSRSEWLTIALLAPIVALATVAGVVLSSRLTAGSMRVALLVLLLLSGVGAIVSALAG